MTKEIIVKRLSEAAIAGDLSYFIGAGVSMGSGFVGWEGLMKDIIKELELNVSEKHNLINIAQYYSNKYGNKNLISAKILNEFDRKAKSNPLLKLMCELPVETIWTTNYDKQIEMEFDNLNKIIDVKRKQNDLSINKRNRDVVLYKMHGDVSDSCDAVIIRDDYERYSKKRGRFIEKLISDLITKTFIFVGYSFQDPNLDSILSKVRITMLENKRPHYYITKKANSQTAKIIQKLKIQDLKNYGIHTLEVDEYEEIEEIFKEVRDKVYKNNIFISGSAYEYKEFGTDEEAKKLIKKLSAELIKNNYKIINGFGFGVGEHIIQGVTEALHDKEYIENDLFELRVFPNANKDNLIKKDSWTHLRNEMISKSRTAIFLFGNKLEDGEIKLANGMKEEFQIAKEHGLRLIPIVSTGYMAKNIFENNPDICIGDKCFKNKDINQIVEKILEIIKGE